MSDYRHAPYAFCGGIAVPDMTTPELIVSLHKRIIKDGKRIAELEAEVNAEGESVTALGRSFDREREKMVQAEGDARGWADSFKQAEAALDSFLGPDGGKTVVELRAELAALKAQRCETCGNEAANGNHALCVGTVRLCNRWKNP